MATIKYTDDAGEHTGTLTPAEYFIYTGVKGLQPSDTIPYFDWDDTDYKPFLQAVNNKFNTTASKAWITRR